MIPLPDSESRIALLNHLLEKQRVKVTQKQMQAISQMTEGYSGSDLTALCKETAMIPLRELGNNVVYVRPEDVRPIAFDDFKAATQRIRPSTQKHMLQALEDWNREYGFAS